MAVQAEIPYSYGSTLPTPPPETPETVSESQAGQGFWLSQDTGSHPGTVLGQDEDLGTETQSTLVSQQTEPRYPVEDLILIFDENWSGMVVGDKEGQCKTTKEALEMFRALTENYSPDEIADAVDAVNSAPGRQVVRKLRELCEDTEDLMDT